MKTSLILFLISLTIRLAVIFFWQFDGLYGQDAYAYFDQAVAIAENLPRGQPPPTGFFWPNGYPLLIAFFMLFAGQTARAGQLAALLSGALLAPLAYLLSRDLWPEDDRRPATGNQQPANKEGNVGGNHRAGILAGLIVAVAGQPILSSVVIMADMPALFWAALGAWLLVHAMRQVNWAGNLKEFEGTQGNLGELGGTSRNFEELRGTQGNLGDFREDHYVSRFRAEGPLWAFHVSRHFLAAGAALALAIISRWLYALIIPALACYVLLRLSANSKPESRLQPEVARSDRLKPRLQDLPWGSFLLAILSGILILAPQLWLSLQKPEGLAHSFLLGWSPLHFFQRQFENSEGHFSYLLPMAVFYAQPAGHPAYIFPLLGLASAWGIWRLWQTRQWATLTLLLGWASPVYLFLAGISFQNFRFGLTLYLPLVLLTGFGLNDLWEQLQRDRGAEGQRRKSSSAPSLLCSSAPLPLCSPALMKILIALSLAGMLLWAYPMLNNFLTAQNQSKLIARQVEQTVPEEATLLTFGLTLTMQHYTQLNTLEFFYQDPNSLSRLTQTSTPLYLLLDLYGIETQWQGKTPDFNYRWLKDHQTLTEVGTFPPYTLLKVSTTDK